MSSGIAVLFSRTFGTRWGWGVSPTPQPPLPPGKTRYPFYRRLGGPQGRSGQKKNLIPTGIVSRTVQPVAQSLYRLSYPAHTHIMLNKYSIFITNYVLHVSVFVTPSSGDHCVTCSKLYTVCIVSVKCTVHRVF